LAQNLFDFRNVFLQNIEIDYLRHEFGGNEEYEVRLEDIR
jgi:hypothetical protein